MHIKMCYSVCLAWFQYLSSVWVRNCKYKNKYQLPAMADPEKHAWQDPSHATFGIFMPVVNILDPPLQTYSWFFILAFQTQKGGMAIMTSKDLPMTVNLTLLVSYFMWKAITGNLLQHYTVQINNFLRHFYTQYFHFNNQITISDLKIYIVWLICLLSCCWNNF